MTTVSNVDSASDELGHAVTRVEWATFEESFPTRKYVVKIERSKVFEYIRLIDKTLWTTSPTKKGLPIALR